MASQFDNTLRALLDTPGALTFNRGIERETLRVDTAGNLARTPHPKALGAKLTHPLITTDFSESQPELITPVSQDIDATLSTLDEIHRFVVASLEDEVLWSASMPCVLQGDNTIPLAQYGQSNLGRLKTTYRHGLGMRYGRAMQTICAVHYNFSFGDSFWSTLSRMDQQRVTPEYISRRYFDLMRNFRRLSWLPVLLFGASPAVCNSFVKGRENDLERFDEGSLYARNATSLRSGNLGYQSDLQSGQVDVCYNSLENYVARIAAAICTNHEPYAALGLKDGNLHTQVSASILQSEAEFYSTIRAKRVPPKGSNFLKVLLEGGVEYVEVRLLDVNPYLPTGIDAAQMRFLDMFLLYCILIDSPLHDDALCESVASNVRDVVWRGRDPDLALNDQGVQRTPGEWGLSVIRNMAVIAATMDRSAGGSDYADSLTEIEARISDVSLTPSARILADMTSQSIPFFRFAMNQALSHQAYFRSRPLPADRQAWFNELAQQSQVAQLDIEGSDQVDFDTYLAAHNADYLDLL